MGRLATLEDTFSPTLQLLQLSPALDFARTELPPTAAYVGALRRPERGVPPPIADQRPIAFCSLGTRQGGRSRLFRTMAAAASAAGLCPVVAHGGRLSEAAARALPGAPLVADFLPQRPILQRARVAITHGGLNTVLDALSCGVPLIVLPLAFEQSAIAARVAASGAGLVVTPQVARYRLAAAVRRVMADATFAAQARRLQAELTGAGGAAHAARLIETHLCAERRPVSAFG